MRTVTLHPAEDPGESITVVVSPVPVDAFYDIVGRINGVPRTRKAFDAMAERFAPFLVGWTYPHPTTAEGLAALDVNLVVAYVQRWAQEVALIPLPLLASSSDGDTPPGEPSPSP